MDLYTFIMVEPVSSECVKVRPSHVLNVLGNFPQADSDGPWNDAQCRHVRAAVTRWYHAGDKDVDLSGQRQRLLRQIETADFCFVLAFHTSDGGDLDNYRADTEALFDALWQDCAAVGLRVSRYDSL